MDFHSTPAQPNATTYMLISCQTHFKRGKEKTMEKKKTTAWTKQEGKDVKMLMTAQIHKSCSLGKRNARSVHFPVSLAIIYSIIRYGSLSFPVYFSFVFYFFFF